MSNFTLPDSFVRDLITSEGEVIEDILFTRDATVAGETYWFVIDIGQIDEGLTKLRYSDKTTLTVFVTGPDAEMHYRAKISD